MEENNNIQATAEPEAKTYTEEEVNSLVSRAVNGALSKYKEKQSKSTDERVAELEAELARRDNIESVRKGMKEANIPDALESLFIGDGYEDKFKVFNDWFTFTIESEVQNKLSSVKPINQAVTTPIAKKGRRSLSEINDSL